MFIPLKIKAQISAKTIVFKGGKEMAYKKGNAVRLSNNFISTEFDCKGNGCCSETLIDEKLVNYLQQIRNHFGRPVIINSGYRCTSHNKAVNGATKSKHLYGMAADIYINGIEPKEVAKYAESLGIKGIGLYDTFVHIDTRTTKSFWYGSNQEYRSTFGGTVKEEAAVVEDVLKVGDKVKLTSDATYFNGASIPSWVKKMKLYVRGFRKDGYIVISTQKTGAITGAVGKKFLKKI